ncbi:Major facilitator superfamily domain, general substrate transporter [Cordyceps fumosorosea ARSEF 2679]|uniref:Major facilitator superfamily domain, general substrate transporter n=1 Tax=Cordyceps fumosorosea (strain ARSEF 2679) TaxID=1081104 RepID=A0A167TQ14_CORFA|nr:Major facilitator superfamily domain, general substrate transporter [Cordyceps fumosorosea ARSEF 2679]OAA60828.1 Major facilitator superfamily domain, general substrate transporter [Cordyceps fumosorosea ARSEF 2679]
MPGFVNSSSSFTLPVSASYHTRKPSLGSWSTTHKSVGIKYGRGKYADVELMPQPSDDPDDPLNWPRWRKDLNLAALLSVVALAGALKTVFLTTAAVAAERYRTSSYLAVAALTGVPLMLSALTGTAACVAARVWGRRPVYMLATGALFVGSVWNATAVDSYGSCMGARVVQGLAWGVFDTLVMTSIQDTYFEHQRNLRVTLYNVLNITATWGAPLLGGLLSSSHPSDLVYQLRVISGLFLLAIPLLCLAAPETAFDRSHAAAAPTPVSGFTLSRRRRWQPWRVKHRLTRARVLGYLRDMRPLTFRHHRQVTRELLLQVPRALAAPTTLLVVLLSVLPVAALWGLAGSLSLLLAPRPVGAGPATLGAVMTGPWIAPALIAGSLALYRGVHLQFTRLANCLVVCGGSSLALVGILSFGLGVGNFMTTSPSPLSGSLFSEDGAGQLSLALVSFQLAVLAAGAAVLDAATRPSLARSASFTASNMTAALRSIGDMHAGVVVYRNLAAGVFAMAVPVSVARPGGLRAVTLGLAVAQLVVSGVVVAQRCCFDEAVWRADGRVMGLIDLSSLKLSVSYFEPDERA